MGLKKLRESEGQDPGKKQIQREQKPRAVPLVLTKNPTGSSKRGPSAGKAAERPKHGALAAGTRAGAVDGSVQFPPTHSSKQRVLMWSFLAHLARNAGEEHTVVVMDAEGVGQTRRYQVRPSRLLVAWSGSLLLAGLLVAGLLAFTPLRTQIPGYGTEEIEQSARLNTMRLQALQDSLAAQRQYITQLRSLITGRVDSVAQPGGAPPAAPQAIRAPVSQKPAPDGPREEPPNAHRQPAFVPSGGAATERSASGGAARGANLSFPLPPPVENGFPTREYSAETGHYGIDVAVSEGEYIRAVGGGYVVWADWTQDGGHTIAVQHADGYLSIYKHNDRLLKRRGDRVAVQEPIAVSGNTGAITTGPHLHFELWRNGLAQGPKAFIAGW